MKQTLDVLIEHLAGNGFFLVEVVELLEKRMIERALEHESGNRSEAAKKLGIHRNTLQRKMAHYQMGEPQVKRKPVAAEVRSRGKVAKYATA